MRILRTASAGPRAVNGLMPLLPVLLAIGFLLAVAGCGGKSPIAGEEPIDDVEMVEYNIDALRAWVQADAEVDALVHIDIADDIQVFPQSLKESMKNAADHLERGNVDVLDKIASYIETRGIVNLAFDAGLFKRMIWVIPARSSVGQIPLENYKSFLMNQRGFPDYELDDLVSTDKHITGTLVGIPVTITTFDDFESSEGEVILDIDLAYFLGKKSLDPLYQTGTRSTLQFVRDIRSKNLRTRIVTIHLATAAGNNPMDIRYFGSIIAEALREPDKLQPPIFEKWTMMMEAEDSLVAGHYGAAEALYERLVQAHGTDAGLFFTLGVARGFKGDGDGSSEALIQAYRLDGAYLRAFFQLANILAVQEKVEAGIALIETPDLGKIMSDVELNFQRGAFYLNAKRPYDALTYLKKVVQVRPDDFGLQTLLFQAYLQTGDAPQMTLTLEKLRNMDDGRVRREMPWVYKELGRLYEEATLYKNAMESYQRYLDVVPDAEDRDELRGKVEAWRALYDRTGSGK
jgi:tetratricopeptide (TPR) repeat protein